MPTWFKCRNCKEKFYTAKSEFQINKDERCYKCGGILDKICREIERVLEEGDLVEMLLTPGEEDRRARVEVENIEEDCINMSVIDGYVSPARANEDEIVEVRFTRKEPRPGRFSFKSELINYESKEDLNIIISKPNHAVHHQERRAPRFPLNTEAKFRVAESEEDLEPEKSYERGETVDLSVTGVLVASDDFSPEEVEEDKPVKLKLELEEHELEIEGRIARIAELKQGEKKKAGMGIEFTALDEDERRILKKLRNYE